jgi:tetratricopeptide (TPR) repeat protein
MRIACAVAAGLAFALVLRGQDDAAFVAALARVEAAPPGERAAAAAAALAQFLGLRDEATRQRHEVAGVAMALAADRLPLAVELATAARVRHPHEPQLVRCHATALLRQGAFAAFVDMARADLASARDVVHAVLLEEEARLLPLAEQALRTGDTARARFVFETLAAVEPPASHRLGNLALCLRQLGELDAARAAYERGLRLAPDDLELRNDYGLFLRATGDLPGAVRAFEAAWQLDLSRPPDRRGRGPAVTNLVHLAATRPGVLARDPIADAVLALAVRPDATMLKRLVLDVAADRLGAAR